MKKYGLLNKGIYGSSIIKTSNVIDSEAICKDIDRTTSLRYIKSEEDCHYFRDMVTGEFITYTDKELGGVIE